MINLFGKMVSDRAPIIRPSTVELDSNIKNGKIVYVTDHVPNISDIRIRVKGAPQYFKNPIIEKFNDAQISIDDKSFIFDHYLNFDDFENSVYTGGILYTTASFFLEKSPSWNSVPEFHVTKKLTFMSNKARDHRTLVSCVLANLFDINDIAYSYTKKSANNIVEELLLGTDYAIDNSKQLVNKWITVHHEKEIDRVDWHSYGTNHDVYFDKLFGELYENSAVSLITEPNFQENGSMLTEKTIMSIYAGHFLIWPGGWKSAKTAQRLGIDVFDDIINHDYQYIEHPGKRVVEAITSNLELLNNISKQEYLRNMNKDRLNKNLNLVRNLPNLLTAIELINSR